MADLEQKVIATVKSKAFYESSTIWTNIIFIGAVLLNHFYGIHLNEIWQTVVLGGVNIIMRRFTKDPINWF